MSAEKLSLAEKRAVKAAIERARGTDKKGKSAQSSIPYQMLRPDGICQVTPTHFTKTIQFRDINYQLSDNEDKQTIFDSWCDFLNYFDSSVRFQLSFLNLTASEDAFVDSIQIPDQGDEFDSIRQEYAQMLQNQLARGNNGLMKTKYLTFGIDADSMKTAKPRLERLETDILNNFKRMGVIAESLSGQQRLRALHDILRMDTPEPFLFDWKWLPKTGLGTKDFIAPSSFYFNRARDFRMGKKFCRVSFLQILAPELSDRILKDFLDVESNLVVSIHVQSIDQVAAIKTIKRTITDLDKTKIEEQKKAVRSGYDEYVCSSYRHYSRSCTCHYIRVSVVESLVLEAIRRVSGYVRENEAEFIERVREKSELQQEAAVKESRKKLSKAKRRREEIGGLIKKLYEAYATGKIPENHFSELLTGYDTEQKTLDGEIERLQAEIDRYNTDSVRADKFIELVKRHTEFTEFSASLLNEFVEKIIVHEATKVNGVREQEVEIYLNFIGKFDLPEQEEQPEETPVRKSKKKRRHEMTEEQRAVLRERDKVRYARKVAAKKAAEEAQRAAILKGTAYEIRPQEAGAAHAAI